MHPTLTHQLALLRQDDVRRELVAGRDPVHVRMRELGPSDRERVRDGFNRLSKRTIRARFLSEVKPSSRLFAWVDELDGHERIAVGASHAESGAPIGVARYVRDANNPARAEVAITVVDEWQGRGVGTALMTELARRAAEVGITTFSATALAENRAARSLAGKLGDACFGRTTGGVISLDVRIAGWRYHPFGGGEASGYSGGAGSS